MGKKSRGKGMPESGSNADIKRFRRALRMLDLVDSRLDLASWTRQVSRHIGEQAVDEWFARDHSNYADVYDHDYSSFERAMHFSVGWRSWPLAAECEWMIPRLRDAINRAGHDKPFLVEIGAGPGAAAALISAALKVPVIAVDSHPKTHGLAEQFADRTGGSVESRIADISDLANALDGRVPTAVFGMGIYRHLQPHNHTRESFSDWTDMKEILASHQVGPQVDSFIKALGGADLLLAEVTCTDYLVEVAAGLLPFGYEIPKSGITRIEGATPEGQTVVYGVHFSTAALPARNPNLLIEMFSPLPLPHSRFETAADNGPAAEALRLSLESTEFVEAAEIVYADRSGRLRREIFIWQDRLVGQYESSTRGFRRLKFFPIGELDTVRQKLRDNDAHLEAAGAARVRPCSLPAPLWASALDK